VTGKPLACDACGGDSGDVREVDRSELRRGVSPWIRHLCRACRKRLGREREEEAA
jgi:hypothetical protein